MDVLREKIKLPETKFRKGVVKVYRLKVKWVGGQRSVMLCTELRKKMGVDEGDYLLLSETKKGDYYLEKEERD